MRSATLAQKLKLSLVSVSSVTQSHSLLRQLLHMHQNTPRHAFTPVLHQSSSILPNPALMGPQDRNVRCDYFNYPHVTLLRLGSYSRPLACFYLLLTDIHLLHLATV